MRSELDSLLIFSLTPRAALNRSTAGLPEPTIELVLARSVIRSKLRITAGKRLQHRHQFGVRRKLTSVPFLRRNASDENGENRNATQHAGEINKRSYASAT
jgi:hypothetical protein